MSQPSPQQSIPDKIPETGGILNIDKPSGMTSHDVVSRLRRLTGIRRIGHTGTLDPLATGVLLLCLGRATRLSEYLIGQDKRYLATIRLGLETNTYDAEGELTADKPVTVDQAAIESALSQFRGPIEQVPPMFSAIKKDGQPLYKMAREGVEIDRPSRAVTIYALRITSWDTPDLQLDIRCSSGTYIRSIAHDLGNALGCGGHITALRRTEVGRFSVEHSTPLKTLTADSWPDSLQPADAAVGHLPAIEFLLDEAARLKLGQRLTRSEEPDQYAPNEPLRAYSTPGQFIGLVTAGPGYWQPHKILVPS